VPVTKLDRNRRLAGTTVPEIVLFLQVVGVKY
jgi:hypothetical protein